MKRIVLALLALAAFGFSAAEAQEAGRWRRAESEHFIVHSDRSESELREAVQQLEDFDATLRFVTRTTQPPSPNKLEVYLVRGTVSLREVAPGVSETIRGFYSATAERVAAFVIFRDLDVMDRETVLFHEYAHHFMLHNFPQAYPSWYVEGWAEFVSTFEFSGRRVIVGSTSTRSYSLFDFDMLPIEQMLAPERVEDEDQYFGYRFYAIGWFATLYLYNHPERDAGFRRYVEALGEGADPIEAFEPAFGITPAQFGEELARFRSGRVERIAIRLPDERAAVTITRMPRSADDLLLRAAGLQFRVTGTTPNDSVATRVEEIAERFGDDVFALRASARAALTRRDHVAARTRLERALAQNPDDAEAHYLLAVAQTISLKLAPPEDMEAGVREARRHLRRAFALDPNHYPTLYAYATSFIRERQRLTNEQLDVLARALELAPQVGAIRLTLAQELLKANEFDTGVAVLRPLMYAPHDTDFANRARVMFQAAQRHEQPPAWSEADKARAEANAEGRTQTEPTPPPASAPTTPSPAGAGATAAEPEPSN